MLRPILVHDVRSGIILQVTKELSEENQSREWYLNFKFPLLKVLSFKYAKEWPKWIRRSERYRLASSLDKKFSKVQVIALIYNMGDQADNILLSFRLSDENKKI